MSSKHDLASRLALFALAALLFATGSPSFADDPPKKAGDSAKSEKKAEPPVSPIYQAARAKGGQSEQEQVFTNEDLERMMANLSPEQKLKGVYQAERHIGATETKEQPSPDKPQDAEAWLKERKEGAADKQRRVGEAQQRVADLERRLAELERSVMATKNPLLPKTWRKPTPEEGQEQELEGLDNKARRDVLEQQLEQTRKELEQARQELAGARSG